MKESWTLFHTGRLTDKLDYLFTRTPPCLINKHVVQTLKAISVKQAGSNICITKALFNLIFSAVPTL